MFDKLDSELEVKMIDKLSPNTPAWSTSNFCVMIRPLPHRGRVRGSLVPRHQIFRARPAALSKNRVWTPSLVKLGHNYTSVVSCCRTNQIAQVK